jgi:glycosyltransferase involved in cell wall biosynthesis
MPKVSVVIPTYNRREWLTEAVDSVLRQSYADYEIIVADHGSTDGTAAAMKKIFGEKVRLLSLENCPLPACPRNHGIRAAKGEYVAFLDSDDLWLPDKLESQIPAMEANPEWGWSYGNAERFGPGVSPGTVETGAWQLYSGDVFRRLMLGNFIPSCTVVARRKCLEEAGGFDETAALRSAEDYELWLRLASRYRLHAVPRVVARYRVSEGQISKDPADGFEPERLALEKVRSKIGVDEEIYRRALAALHLRYFRYTVFSNSTKAARHLAEAVAQRASLPRLPVYRVLWTIGGAGIVRIWIGWERSLKRWLTSSRSEPRRANG